MSFNLGDLNPVRILAGKGEIGKSGLGSALATLALDYFAPGLGSLETAGIVGGGTALASGSLQKGLMAGIGAYGAQELAGAAEKGISDAAARSIDFGDIADANPTTPLTTGEQFKAGLSGLKTLPTADLLKYGAMAAAPVLTAQSKTGLPSNPTNPNAYIRPKTYDPVSHRYYDLPAIKADEMGSQSIADYVNSQVAPAQAARGGLMAAYADGGMAVGGDAMNPNPNPNPASGPAGQLAYNNEPVMRMAGGGIAHFADGGFSNQQISDYVANIQAQGGGDKEIAAAMDQFHVDPGQLAGALGMNVGDVQSRYNAAEPTGGYVSVAAPTTSASFFAPGGQGSQIAALEGQGVNGATAAQQVLNPYTSYTNDQYGAFFADPKNAAVLQTPGGLAAAEAQYKADPNAAMAYLQSNADKLNLSNADIYQLGQGQGVQGVYTGGDQWVKEHPNATGAEIQAALKAAGWNDNDVQNYFSRANTGYGTNVATGKSFTGAGDIYQILNPNHGGFSDITTNINKWIKDHPTATLTDAQAAMSAGGINELDVQRATGKTSAQIYADAKKDTSTKVVDTGTKTNTGTTTGIQIGTAGNATAPVPGTSNVTQTVLPTNSGTNAPAGTANPYGNQNNPGDVTFNADNSKTVQPNIPGRPYGGFSGMDEVTNAWTAGGGHLGQILAPSKTYQNTGGSKSAYDYLSGQGTWAGTRTQPAAKVRNTYSNIASPSAAEKAMYAKYPKVWVNGAMVDNPYYGKGTDSSSTTTPATDTTNYQAAANGGLMALAAGGMSNSNLGSYSDGGRLLRGPGDGVSDSIPATIGNKQPARLADGEFVVPARIVSEIGNGSTEAGARKLYAMMDRVQSARSKTVGKGKVAKNTRADKYLPA